MERKILDTLYTEAMVLADEARAYFDGREARAADFADSLGRVTFSCESLKVTTRLMHILAWLLAERARADGDRLATADFDLSDDSLRPDPVQVIGFPEQARHLIAASEDLYDRVSRLQERRSAPPWVGNPVADLLARVEHAF